MKVKRSYGIAVCRVNPSSGKYEILLVRKNNTFAFNSFVLQKHSRSNPQKILNLLNNMTFDEKLTLSTLDFGHIWHRFQFSNPKSPFLASHTKIKKEDYSRFVYCDTNFSRSFLSDRGTLLLELIERSHFASDLWEIPKGRKNPREKDLNCAIREVSEETGISHNQYTILNDSPKQITQSTKFVKYESYYFVAMAKDQSLKLPSPPGLKLGSFPEITESRWVSLDSARSIDTSVSRKLSKTIEEIFSVLDKKYNFKKLIKNGYYPAEF
jgi:8-oxo-dGTP pyrophosphatase MutT (NUDIX family)